MKFRERLTFANLVSVLALIVAVAGTGGGVAYAHGKIGSGDLKNNAVKSKHIKKGKVKSSDLKNNNVKSKDIKDGQVNSADVKDGSLTGEDVSDGSLTVSDLDPEVLSGIAEAWLSVDGNGAVLASFNRKGGTPTVNHTGVGNYTITVPGTSATDDTAVVSVNGGSIVGEACIMEDVNGDGSFDVDCFDTDSPAYSDEEFQFVLFHS